LQAIGSLDAQNNFRDLRDQPVARERLIGWPDYAVNDVRVYLA